MRVIGGTVKRTILKAPTGFDTRPTTDRIRETLFNMLQGEMTSTTVLDLFSGSGAIGIEALSRGAKRAVFVENDRRALSCIHENLIKTGFVDRALVIEQDVFVAIHSIEQQGIIFDYVFADPPYRMGYEEKVLKRLETSPILSGGTVIIFESAMDTPVDYVNEGIYSIQRIKEYSTNKHIFFERNSK